jgi:N-acetylmuramoyl-L-alanine amidase
MRVLLVTSVVALVTPLFAAPMRIVIDPGHGGAEDGAIGPSGLKEKELTLDVAQRLSELLSSDGFEVKLTRDEDHHVELDTRAGIANNFKAELFISLHANASRFAKARGAETYFLAREATDDAARTVAAIENDAAGVANASEPNEGGDLALILWDMAQNEFLEQSRRFALEVQGSLNQALGIADRGVRQAPFRVLIGATCPAVLVELGFMTNPQEEQELASTEYRQKLAVALHRAISAHRDEIQR